MARSAKLQNGIALVACWGLLCPPVSTAADASRAPTQGPDAALLGQAPEPVVQDVALGPGGNFHGQVVDAQGLPLARLAMSLHQDDAVVATTMSDQDGNFSVSELAGGVYRVDAGPASGIYRLWSNGAAPPGASHSALLVAGQPLVRGQGGWMYWATNPWVIGGVIAAAITIPIAVTNHNRHSGS